MSKKFKVTFTRSYELDYEDMQNEAFNFFGIEKDAFEDTDEYLKNLADDIAREYLEEEMYLGELDGTIENFPSEVEIISEQIENQ